MGNTASGAGAGKASKRHDGCGPSGELAERSRFAILVTENAVRVYSRKGNLLTLQNSPIRIGSIDLHDFEIPQSVHFGGRQRLAIHALADGNRMVERLGPDDDDIQFQGTFSGPTAESRARAFDNMRLSGAIVWLTWESFRRQVIVRSFTADYASPWWIHYRLSCVVVYQTRINASALASVAAMLAADLSSALSMVSASGISLSGLQAALSNNNSLTAGTADQTQAVAAVASQMEGVNNQITQQSNILGTAIPIDSTPADLGRSYISKVNCSRMLAATANIRGYIGRIGVNIAGAGGA